MKRGICESADAVWKLVQVQKPTHQPAEEVAPVPQQPEVLLATLAETERPAPRTTAGVAGEQLACSEFRFLSTNS